MSKSTFKNLDAIPTWKLKEILDDSYCISSEGTDYHPVKEYLQSIYYARLQSESERDQKHFDINQKALFKAQHKTRRTK